MNYDNYCQYIYVELKKTMAANTTSNLPFLLESIEIPSIPSTTLEETKEKLFNFNKWVYNNIAYFVIGVIILIISIPSISAFFWPWEYPFYMSVEAVLIYSALVACAGYVYHTELKSNVQKLDTLYSHARKQILMRLALKIMMGTGSDGGIFHRLYLVNAKINRLIEGTSFSWAGRQFNDLLRSFGGSEELFKTMDSISDELAVLDRFGGFSAIHGDTVIIANRSLDTVGVRLDAKQFELIRDMFVHIERLYRSYTREELEKTLNFLERLCIDLENKRYSHAGTRVMEHFGINDKIDGIFGFNSGSTAAFLGMARVATSLFM